VSWVSVGVSVGSALLGSRGAKKAARAREQAYADASGMVSTGYNQATEYLDPRYRQEQMAIERINALTGLSGEPVDFDLFRNTPGYRFLLDQGTQARERLASAAGGVISGNTLAALEEYGQGLADQTFNNYLSQVGMLAGQGVDNVLAGLSVNRGTTLGNLRLGQGGARASGIEDSTNALVGGASSFLDLYGKRKGWGAVPKVP